MTPAAARSARYRARLHAQGLTAHGTTPRILPRHLAAEHAETLRLVAGYIEEYHPVSARTLKGIAGDLEHHANPNL